MKGGLRRGKRVIDKPEITLTPLIDTALTLLIIFMVTSPMMNHNAIKVDLPQGKTQEGKDTQQELVVHIDKDEHLYLNGNPVNKDSLTQRLAQQLAQSKNPQTVFIKADKHVSYGSVINIVDEIKMMGGIHRVVMATQKA